MEYNYNNSNVDFESIWDLEKILKHELQNYGFSKSGSDEAADDPTPSPETYRVVYAHNDPSVLRYELCLGGEYEDDIVITLLNTGVSQCPNVYEILAGDESPNWPRRTWLGKGVDNLVADLAEAISYWGA